ncbi:MAG TPA: hypothetical protein VLF94_05830 [Chlamydiales bacterium]|nr:hypothetical protein [Chlamydiales bacterium]
MYREIIDRLIAYPQRGQIKVDFDLKLKIFRLSIPIFVSKPELPPAVRSYVEARKEVSFKPHTTSFQISDHKVLLVQEIPFTVDFQSTLRKQVDAFWHMSKECHRMLSEMAIEEKYKTALHLDSHSEE